MRKIGPNLMMPTILTLWGMVCALQGKGRRDTFLFPSDQIIPVLIGTVKSYAGLVVIRAFLGLIEGPMFPGIVLYLSGFYTRKELSTRYALFFACLLIVLTSISQHCSVLLRCLPLRRVFRFTRSRNRKYGWSEGKAGMGLDLHSGRQ